MKRLHCYDFELKKRYFFCPVDRPLSLFKKRKVIQKLSESNGRIEKTNQIVLEFGGAGIFRKDNGLFVHVN